MNSKLAQVAGLGFVALGVQILSTEGANSASANQANIHGADLAGLVGSDEVVNTKVLLEAKSDSLLDSSGCISVPADTSGLFGWYAQPVVPAHPAFAINERMGVDTAIGGNTIAVLSERRVAIFELNAQNIPEFRAFTPEDDSGISTRQVAVAPDGQEIAVRDGSGTVAFFRRSTLGWTGATAAQILSSIGAGKALTYAADGTQLFVEVFGITPRVEVFQRNTSGNWESVSATFPGKLTPVSGRSLGWSSDRLLVSDSSAMLVYKRTPSGFDFSHTLGLPGAPTQLNIYPGGFSAHSNGQLGAFITFFAFDGTRFTERFLASGLNDETRIATPFPIFLGANRNNGNACASVSFSNDAHQPLGKYFIPKGLNKSPRSIVAGLWGLVVTTDETFGSPGVPGEVYFIARDRIFGGQNPPIGSLGRGQGGFE